MSRLMRRPGACDKLGHSSAAAVYAMVYYGLPLSVTRCAELNKMMVFVAVSDLLPYILMTIPAVVYVICVYMMDIVVILLVFHYIFIAKCLVCMVALIC